MAPHQASLYGVPIVIPTKGECGVVGCAAMARTALRRHRNLDEAVGALVHHDDEIAPHPAWQEH